LRDLFENKYNPYLRYIYETEESESNKKEGELLNDIINTGVNEENGLCPSKIKKYSYGLSLPYLNKEEILNISNNVYDASCLSASIFNSSEETNIVSKNYIGKSTRIGAPSVYGVVFEPILKSKDRYRITSFTYCINDMQKKMLNLPFAIKTPQYSDDKSIIHEAFIGIYGINKLRQKISNFVYTYGITECSATFYKNNDIISSCSISGNTPYLILENLSEKDNPSRTLYDAIKSDLTSEEFVMIYLQILLALNVAKKEIDFTHYDLHANNVLLKKKDKDGEYFNYKTYLPDERKIYIRIREIAVIIDYGFSHCNIDARDYGKNIWSLDVVYNKSFPLYDAYRLLMACCSYINSLLSYDKNNIRLKNLYNSVEIIYNYFTQQILMEGLIQSADIKYSIFMVDEVIDYLRKNNNIYLELPGLIDYIINNFNFVQENINKDEPVTIQDIWSLPLQNSLDLYSKEEQEEKILNDIISNNINLNYQDYIYYLTYWNSYTPTIKNKIKQIGENILSCLLSTTIPISISNTGSGLDKEYNNIINKFYINMDSIEDRFLNIVNVEETFSNLILERNKFISIENVTLDDVQYFISTIIDYSEVIQNIINNHRKLVILNTFLDFLKYSDKNINQKKKEIFHIINNIKNILIKGENILLKILDEFKKNQTIRQKLHSFIKRYNNISKKRSDFLSRSDIEIKEKVENLKFYISKDLDYLYQRTSNIKNFLEIDNDTYKYYLTLYHIVTNTKEFNDNAIKFILLDKLNIF
jgi:hypothetical protein